MCADMEVDQAAAVVLTTVAEARHLGIPEERFVYPLGSAGARDTSDFLERSSYARSPAMEASLDDALTCAGVSIDAVDLVELYSCFPCVPKMASDHLGLDRNRSLSVTGGLTFFGGPGNAYMLFATVAMVRAIRGAQGAVGLLYGQGEFVTKHHALLCGATRRDATGYPPERETRRQAIIDRLPVPNLVKDPSGAGSIEASTVVFDRSDEPVRGLVVGRLDDGDRFLAVADPSDSRTIDVLMSIGGEPVGVEGSVSASGGLNHFRV
jgi:hypothetical protein